MNVSIDPALKEHGTPLAFGIIHYTDCTVADSPQMLKGRLQLFQESLFFDLQDQPVTSFNGIAEWRSIFKALGKDPNRYRPSTEALYRRIKKQNYLEPQHSAVDLNNFFSLQYESPIGLYDRNLIDGDVVIRLGKEEEQYEGLNGRQNSLHNLLVTADENGAFGSPYVDSTRTAASTATTSALQIIYLRPSLPLEQQKELTASLMNMFIQVHGGNGTYEVITT